MRELPKSSIFSWLIGAPRAVEADGVRVYRLRRVFLILGVGSTAFFASAGVASVLLAWWNVDGSFPYPRTLAIVFGVVLGGFTLLSSYLILAYYRERLFVGDLGMLQQGCFKERSLTFSDLTSVQWSASSGAPDAIGPWIVLCDPQTKVVIRLNQWANVDERRELIERLRQAIDPRLQQDWETFESRILVDPSGLSDRGFEA